MARAGRDVGYRKAEALAQRLSAQHFAQNPLDRLLVSRCGVVGERTDDAYVFRIIVPADTEGAAPEAILLEVSVSLDGTTADVRVPGG